MDTVEKRAAGIPLNARDEQRLRNHQLRMMRRAWLSDMRVSPREPLWPGNDLWFGKPKIVRNTFNFTNYWKLLSDKLFLPKGVRPFYHFSFLDELLYGRIQYTPQLAVWGTFRAFRLVLWWFPFWLAFKVFKEEICLAKYPTNWGLLPDFNHNQKCAARIPHYPSDKTFTTRLRNVEFGHDYMNLREWTPRMKPDAQTFPAGTRMNWLTFQPILPEDNHLLNEEYGNGPGGVGPMTETYRLVHATKPYGLHSKIDPDEPHAPFRRPVRKFIRALFNKRQVDDYNQEDERNSWHPGTWSIYFLDMGEKK